LTWHWADLAPPTPGGSTLRTRRSGPESSTPPSTVVKLATAIVDEVRRRVQQEQLGHRGHQDDPLYKIRGLLRHDAEHLTERQRAKLRVLSRRWRPERRGRDGLVLLPAAPADLQQPQPAKARRALAEKVIASFPSCPIPEVARLGRTLRACGSQVLAYLDTGGVSNGGTEAINMLIEKARRLAHSYRNLENYRLRMLLATGGHDPSDEGPHQGEIRRAGIPSE